MDEYYAAASYVECKTIKILHRSMHLVQSALVSRFWEKRVTVWRAGVLMTFTRYGLFVSKRSLYITHQNVTNSQQLGKLLTHRPGAHAQPSYPNQTEVYNVYMHCNVIILYLRLKVLWISGKNTGGMKYNKCFGLEFSRGW